MLEKEQETNTRCRNAGQLDKVQKKVENHELKNAKIDIVVENKDLLSGYCKNFETGNNEFIWTS